MSTIAIDGKDYTVMRTLRPGVVIADSGGAFAFATLYDSTMEWDWYGGEVTPEDAAALREVIEAHGGFDHTTIVVEPPTQGTP